MAAFFKLPHPMLRPLIPIILAVSPLSHAAVHRVAEGASGAGNGTTWTDAYPRLQDALTAAVAGDEIWVAAGTYYPDERTGQPDGSSNMSFNLKASVPVYGGFAGTETLRGDRAPEQNLTVLSGDMGQDDVNLDGNRIAEKAANIVGTNSVTVVKSTSYGIVSIDGFTITAGSASGVTGGGLFVLTGTFTASRCDFRGNRGPMGGAVHNASLDSTFINCTFSGNSAGSYGGAVYTSARAKATNCLFHSNTAASSGGAWCDNGGGSSVLAQCTFSANSAESGGAIYNFNGSLLVRNSILWGNHAFGKVAAVSASVAYLNFPVSFSRCLVAGSGGSGSWVPAAGTNAGGNLDADPMFLAKPVPLGLASPVATSDFHTFTGSPVTNAGSLANLPIDATDADGDGDVTEALPLDLARAARVIGPTPDMGVFESGGPAVLAAAPLVKLAPNSGLNAAAAQLSGIFGPSAVSYSLYSATPSGMATIAVDPATGDIDITPEPDVIGTLHLIVAATDASGVSSYVPMVIEVFPPVVFVNAAATGAATGLSWEDAFPTLQAALVLGGSNHEIRVAKGVYFPDEGPDQTLGSTSASFQVPAGVTLRGGYSGTSPTENTDPEANPTILSGDVGRDDLDADGNHVAETPADLIGSNASTLIVLNAAPANAGLDNFIITAAGLNLTLGPGCGLQISGGSPFISRCRFSGCRGQEGAAVAAKNSATPRFTNCKFTGNVVRTAGGAVHGNGGSLSFVDCDFTGNAGNYIGVQGGAISVVSSHLSMRRCEFRNNRTDLAFGAGGAIHGWGSSFTVTDCLFQGNASYYGGAVSLKGSTGSTFTACLMRENTALSNGGAVYLDQTHPAFSGCEFSANRAKNDGGAFFNLDASPTLAQCTLTGNAAGAQGGALFNRRASAPEPTAPALSNCIVWNNKKGSPTPMSGDSVEDINSEHHSTFSNCLVQHSGGSAAWNPELGIDLGSNLDADPRFLLSPEPGVITSQAIDLRLQAGSPAINVGSASLIPGDIADLDEDGNVAEALPLDLAGKPRVAGANPDAGAYESETGPALLAPFPRLRFDTLSGAHPGVLDLATFFDPSAVSIGIVGQSSSPAVAAEIDFATGILDLTVLPDTDGTTYIAVRATDAAGHSTYHTLLVDVFPPVVFVNGAATGKSTGLSWEDAYPTLQAALAFPRIAGIPLEIWVAEGIYYPDQGPGQTSDAETSTFPLPTACSLYGGFAGGETQRSQRDLLTRPTILSGDLAQDDLNSDGNHIAESFDAIVGTNALTVVSAAASGADMVLDGFVITAGNNRLSGPRSGGLISLGGDVTVRGCSFQGNHAITGGAVYINNGWASFTECRFSRNLATSAGHSIRPSGGAVLSINAEITMTSCSFEANQVTDAGEGGALGAYGGGSLNLVSCDFEANASGGRGGSIAATSTPLTLEDCRFSGSIASGDDFSEGGAVSCKDASASLTRCAFFSNHSGSHGGGLCFEGNYPLHCASSRFVGNAAGYSGGGVLVSSGSPVRFTNCLFAGNACLMEGGGIYSATTDTIYSNCTFTANRADLRGGAIFEYPITPSRVIRINNSILWGNQAAGSQASPSASIATETYKTPLTTFEDSIVANSGGSATWSPAFGIDGGGNRDADPVFLIPVVPAAAPTASGNFQLSHGSPALDIGDNSLVIGATDLDGAPRITNGTVDLGAYEAGNDQRDTDGDGLSDAFELSATTPPSRTNLAADDDTDGDGLSNRLEFVFGFDPQLPDAGSLLRLQIMEAGGNRYLSVRYRRNAWALQFFSVEVERSLDLGSGNPWSSDNTTPVAVIPTDANVDDIIVRSNAPLGSLPSEFLRVRVEER